MAEFDDIDRGWDDLLGDAAEPPADEGTAEPVAAEEPSRSDEATPATDAEHVDAEELEAEDAEDEAEAREVEEEAVEAEVRAAEAEAVEAEAGAAEAEDEDAREADDEGTAVDDPIAWRSPPAFDAAEADDEPTPRRVPAWTFAALGVPVVALIWYVGASRDEPEPTKPAAAVVEAPAARSSEKAPPPRDPPEVAPVDAPENDPPERAPEAEAQPDPDPPSLDTGAIDEHASAYEAAQQQYRDTKSPEALEAMGLAACRMDDGAKARSTYRKMRDRDARRNVFEACRVTKIDLRWSGDGYTPVELVRRAARALEGGDARQALQLARESNNTTRSDAAILVMARAHCALGHPGQAEHLLPHLSKTSRQALHAACSKAGHDVGP